MNKFIIIFLTCIAFSYSLKGQCDIRMYDIYTPKNNPVCTYFMCEQSNYWRSYYDSVYISRYPNAVPMEKFGTYYSTRKFNCHGYAWLRVEQGIDRWIGTGWSGEPVDPEKAYINDGSYTLISNPTYPGKVWWGGSGEDHTAVTTSVSGVVISKWNEWPLMKHQTNYSPFGTSNKYQYYKRIMPTISGSAAVCYNSPQNFNATTWLSGMYWEKSSSLINISDPTLSSTQISVPSSSNTGTVRLSIKNSSGEELALYDVAAGAPSLTIIGPSSVPLGSGGSYEAYCSSHFGSVLSSYEWGFSQGGGSGSFWSSGCWGSGSFWSEGYYQISCRVKSTCNVWGPWAFLYTWVYNYSPSSSYPNPVSDMLTIETGSSSNTKAQGSSPTYDIRLYNGQGNIVRHQSNKGGTVQFNVSNLPNGIYYLHIYDGVSSKPEMQQIVVEH